MSFQTGSSPLSVSQQDLTVVFPAAFLTTPQVVLAHVANYSADDPQMHLEAQAVTKTASGAVFHISGAPDTSNYVVEWLAGSVDLIFAALSAIGKTFLQLPTKTSRPSDSSRIPFVDMYPLPVTKSLVWEDFETWFVRVQADPPASAADEGAFGTWAIDDHYAYFHNGTIWTRIPRDPSEDWSNDVAFKPTREGVAALTSGLTLQTIEFDTPFPDGDPPAVRVSIQNLEAGDKMILSGMVIASTLDGFEMGLNAAPDTADYEVVYEAKQF